jgi:hypothetical protein
MTAQRNPFAFDKPITRDSLGDLFAHHRSRTGGWTMSITPPEPDPANPPAPTPPAPTPPADPPESFEAITSQEEFDKRLGQRLAREREKYADYDEAKRKAAEYDQLQEANRTEQERAVAAAKAEGQTEERQRTNSLLVRAKAETLAAQARFKAPDAVIASLDLSGVTVDDAGVVDAVALKAKIDAAVDSGAFVIEGTTPPPAPRPDPSQGGGGGGDAKPGSIAEARQRAREEREAKQTKTA